MKEKSYGYESFTTRTELWAEYKMPKKRKNIFKMFPKLFFRFFGIFILGKQFCTCEKNFITIACFLHIFFTISKLEVFAFRRFSKNISTIFEKYFKNVLKIIFSIFWHFYTREAILYV